MLPKKCLRACLLTYNTMHITFTYQLWPPLLLHIQKYRGERKTWIKQKIRIFNRLHNWQLTQCAPNANVFSTLCLALSAAAYAEQKKMSTVERNPIQFGLFAKKRYYFIFFISCCWPFITGQTFVVALYFFFHIKHSHSISYKPTKLRFDLWFHHIVKYVVNIVHWGYMCSEGVFDEKQIM